MKRALVLPDYGLQRTSTSLARHWPLKP